MTCHGIIRGLPFESVGVYKVRSVDSKNPIIFPCKFWQRDLEFEIPDLTL
jgi:hypothetical protein